MSDWKAITDDREKYKAYLCSREWALLRNGVRDRCGGKCERCKKNDMQCVHHLTYARKYGERLEDLAGWCNACHEFTHGKTDTDPAAGTKGDTQVDEFIRWSMQLVEGRSWSGLTTGLIIGLALIEQMGIDWCLRARDGEFKPRPDMDCERLEQLIRNRRQEMGIQ